MSRIKGPGRFLARLRERLDAAPSEARVIVAIAGAPASGKSTLAARAVAMLNEVAETAALLPMDGFHYDDEVLVPAGWRPRKGAPHTFDVGGLRAVLGRLRARDEEAVAVPRFDRDLEIARAGAILIARSVRLVVAEGNWLLLDRDPWRSLRPFFDLTALVVVPEEELATRLRRRWTRHGLGEEAIRAKVEANDLPNARLVYAESTAADWTIRG